MRVWLVLFFLAGCVSPEPTSSHWVDESLSVGPGERFDRNWTIELDAPAVVQVCTTWQPNPTTDLRQSLAGPFTDERVEAPYACNGVHGSFEAGTVVYRERFVADQAAFARMVIYTT